MKKQICILGMAAIAWLAWGLHDIHAAKSADKAAGSQCKQDELALHQNMRMLWADHVMWTRNYIVAAVGGAPDAQTAKTRLLKNQEEIGEAIAPYYGKKAGDELTGLLKQHILIAVDLIGAAKARDQTTFKTVNARWQQNGDEIADFLSKVNSNWPPETVRFLMHKHLVTTIAEVTARLEKKYDDDVEAFDEVYHHVLMMADALANGIIKQFPDKFSATN